MEYIHAVFTGNLFLGKRAHYTLTKSDTLNKDRKQLISNEFTVYDRITFCH